MLHSSEIEIIVVRTSSIGVEEDDIVILVTGTDIVQGIKEIRDIFFRRKPHDRSRASLDQRDVSERIKIADEGQRRKVKLLTDICPVVSGEEVKPLPEDPCEKRIIRLLMSCDESSFPLVL